MIVAPARVYNGSSNPEPSPALFSTNTRCPASVKARTPAGVRPTRYSLSLISFGSPMITVSLPGQISALYLLLIPLIVANDERVFDQGFGVGEGLAVGFGCGGGLILTFVVIKSDVPV